MTGDTRLWMYRNGEARLFAHRDHVPADQGWQRFPAPARDGEPLAEAAHMTLTEDRDLTHREKLDRMSRQRLMQVAADCGIGFDFGWTKAQLKQAIVEVLK